MNKFSKRLIAFILILVELIICFVCLTSCSAIPGLAYLSVDDAPAIRSKNTVVGIGAPKISFIDLVSLLDFSLEWNGDMVSITKDEREFILDFAKEELIDSDDGKNLLCPESDSENSIEYCYEFIKNDLLIERYDMELLLEDMQFPVYICRTYVFRYHIQNIKIITRLQSDELGEYNLVIDGKKYKYDDIYYLEDLGLGNEGVYNTMIPATKLLKDLGCGMTKISEDKFLIRKGLKCYTFSVSGGLKFLGIPLPSTYAGGYMDYNYHIVVKGDEIYFSDSYWLQILDWIGIECFIYGGYQEGAVYIISQ